MSANNAEHLNANALPFPFPTITPHGKYGVAVYPPGATFGPRHLRDWEFVWLIEGDALYYHNDQTVATPEGSIVLCRPPGVDSFRWDVARRTRHAYFHFDLSGPLPPSWPCVEDWPLARTPGEGMELLHTLFQHQLTWDGSGEPAQTHLLTLSLLAAFVTGQTTGSDLRKNALPPAVETATEYIARRLDEEPAAPLTLPELARHACVTPEHLCRLFRTATGHSPMETVRLARLDRAVTLLTRTNFAIGEIATLCGFESPFHFSRRVRETYGHSPRELRRAFADGATPPTTRLLRQETVSRRTTPSDEAGAH
jgi:AraC-like DNA-binding protein